MVSAPEVQAASQCPNIRLLGSVQIMGRVQRSPGIIGVPIINGSTLLEITRPLIPTDFQGRVGVYIQIIEFLDPAQEPGAK